MQPAFSARAFFGSAIVLTVLAAINLRPYRLPEAITALVAGGGLLLALALPIGTVDWRPARDELPAVSRDGPRGRRVKHGPSKRGLQYIAELGAGKMSKIGEAFFLLRS